MKLSLLTLITFACLGLIGCSDSGYDKGRYEEMKRVIETTRSNMLGMPFTNASRLLSLDAVPWDRGYDNYPLGEWRFYHFRGFYLAMHLHVLPPGITPDDAQSFTFQDRYLRETGVWWLGQWAPGVTIDKLTDRRTRMSNYWNGFERRGFRVVNEYTSNGVQTKE